MRFTNTGAHFSECRTWRYALWREWDSHRGFVLFVGLNPSTANEVENDTTISKCVGFANKWGFGGIYMLNLLSFCATQPERMLSASDPVGPENDSTFNLYSSKSNLIVAAWGGSVPMRERVRLNLNTRIDNVLRNINTEVRCLGKTQDGSPKHPSRISYDTPLEVFWTPPEEALT